MDPHPDQSPDSEPSDDGTVADAAPAEDEAAGAATTEEPAARDDDADPNDQVGDFTYPDVDTSTLVPADDGEPDDDGDQDPEPETVQQAATGQAYVEQPAGWAEPTPAPYDGSEPTA